MFNTAQYFNVKSYFIILTILLIGLKENVSGQNESVSSSSNAISIYGSSLFLLASPINLSFDRFYHRENTQLGFTLGYTRVYGGNGEVNSGGHLAFTRLSKRSKGFIETKIGISATPIGHTGNSWFLPSKVMPVLSFGYRFKNPDSRNFYRVGLSTGGIGAGIGFYL